MLKHCHYMLKHQLQLCHNQIVCIAWLEPCNLKPANHNLNSDLRIKQNQNLKAVTACWNSEIFICCYSMLKQWNFYMLLQHAETVKFWHGVTACWNSEFFFTCCYSGWTVSSWFGLFLVLSCINTALSSVFIL